MYRLHGFSQSGNTFKVAFLLRALRQPWEPVFVDFMHGATRDRAWLECVRAIDGWASPYDVLPGERSAPKW